MRRFVGAGAGLLLALLLAPLLALLLLVPAAVAADPSMPASGRILISTQGDVTIPADERYDAVVVINGAATIEGRVNAVIVVDGTLVMAGALAETVVAIRTPITLESGTVIGGDLFKLDALVTREGDAEIGGQVRDIGSQLAGLGFVLAPIFILLFIGFAIAAIAAGLLVAALGARQARAAGAIISHRPIEALVAGVIGVFAPIFLLVGLFVSVVGIPLALAILLVVWPLVGFLGYIVAGIWIGELILGRLDPGRVRERPYLASVVGLVVLAMLSIFPPIPALASLFGYGAVLALAWRTFRGHGPAEAAVPGGAMPAPTAPLPV
ncbi:MAG: hypothetical protein AB1736_12375 [Chloroflexota bacterium]